MVTFRYKISFVFLLLFSGLLTASPSSKVDSLLAIAKTAKQDTIKLNAYLEISGFIISTSPDSAFKFAKMAMKIAKEKNHLRGQIQAENMFGNYYQRKAEYEKSLKSYRKCMAMAEKINDLKGLAQATNNIGIVYGNLGEYDKALEIYQKSMEYERKRKNRTGEAEALNNLGVIHYYLGNMDRTIYYLSEAIKIEEELGNDHLLKKGYINLGALMEYTKDYKGALKNYEKALGISEKLKDRHEMSVCLNNIGGVYLNLNELDKSEKIYLQALALKIELGDENGKALSYINLGSIQERKNNKEKAIDYYQKAASISEKVKSKPMAKEAYKYLANVYESQGNYKIALNFQKKMEAIKDSLLNEEKTKVVTEMEAKYQSAEKERMLLIEKNKSAELEKENAIKEKNVAIEKKKTAEAEEARAKSKNIAIALGGGLIALLFLGLFLLQRNRRKSQAEKDAFVISEREKGLKAIIETAENERRRIAKDLHDGIGQQLGGLKLAWQQIGKNASEEEKSKLNRLTEILNETSTEVRNLSHQMMPKMLEQDGLQPALEDMLQKTLGIAGISYEFNFKTSTQRLHSEIELAIYRIAQELVANILKHSEARKVNVDFYERQQKYFLMVEDDGKGFPEKKSISAGLGLQNIRARASAIKGEITFESNPGKGTLVILSVPF